MRWGRLVGWTLLTACVLVLAGAAWVGWKTYQAYVHLQAASTGVTTLQDQLTDITAVDPALTAETVTRLQAEAADAHAAVDDPVYRAASVVPFVGPNLEAIDQVTATVDAWPARSCRHWSTWPPRCSRPRSRRRTARSTWRRSNRLAPLLQSADDSVTDATTQLPAIDRSQLMRPLADAVDTLSGKLREAADVTQPAARAARLLPAMLGSDRPRTYLVVFQNPSELRATGGIFGSYGVLSADNGKLSLREQGAASRQLGYFDPPVADLSPAEQALYGELMAQYPQDVNLTPDFPRAASLFAKMYEQRSGSTVDGVLAIDPVALSYTLEGITGIDVGNGVTLRADNLVDTLLSTAYSQFDEPGQAQRDAFLDSATSTVFSRVMAGQAEPTAIIEGLQRAADERRVLIYSTHPTEERDIRFTSLAGALDADVDKPTIGVFLNDGTGAKLGYYLRNQVHLTEGRCGSDGRSEIQVRVTMTFDQPPADAPSYVTGASAPGEPYVLRTNVLTLAPVGGSVTGAQRDGKAIGMQKGTDGGRPVGAVTVEMSPGTSTELVFTVLPGPSTAVDGVAVPGLVLTPGVNPWRTSVDRFRACTTGAS